MGRSPTSDHVRADGLGEWLMGLGNDWAAAGARAEDRDNAVSRHALFDLRIRAAYRGAGLGTRALRWLTRS